MLFKDGLCICKMGNCCRTDQLSLGTTDFVDTYVYPETAKHYDIETGGFTDVWFAIEGVSDWSRKSGAGRETFKRRIHTYMQHNVCSEPNIVILYMGEMWVFHTRYFSEGTNKFRVIRL
jgi:hypothetical protein